MSKTVIITGAAGSLGTAVVQKFLDLGYKVIATVRPGFDRPFIQHLSLELVEVDLTDEADVQHFVEKTAEKHPHLDAAVLLAGGFAMGGVSETSQHKLHQMIRLNFDTAFNVARAVYDRMMRQPDGGRIVFIGGRPATDPAAGKDMMAYSLSKAMLQNFSEMLNEAGKNRNIFSTTIIPSIIDTPANRSAMPEANFDQWVTTESLANTIAFTCNEESTDWRQPVIKVYGNS